MREQARAKSDMPPLACSVGIMAYNEAGNIAQAIEAILRQRLAIGQISELIVVASGCTDETVSIATSAARNDGRVRLIVQQHREGKASAVNQFLGAARFPILVMVGADVQVKDGTIDVLLRHFHDPTVGMVGGHPIPVNDEATFLGHAVHLLWRLHDRVARQAPKLGEVVAFRNVIPSIPLDTAVDEISVQALITQLGYRLVYEPRAIAYNRGPSTVRDFLRQRRRIYAGHLSVRSQQGYAASTMSVWRIVRALLRVDCFATPRAAWWTVCTVGLETLARGLGHYDYWRRRPHHVWQVAETTKPQLAEAAGVSSQQSVLVFRLIDFHQHELELGAHGSHLLTQRIMQHMRPALGDDAVLSAKRRGTIIAILLADRQEAERMAEQLIRAIEASPVRINGRHEGVSVRLACGIIAFSHDGEPLALSLPASV